MTDDREWDPIVQADLVGGAFDGTKITIALDDEGRCPAELRLGELLYKLRSPRMYVHATLAKQ